MSYHTFLYTMVRNQKNYVTKVDSVIDLFFVLLFKVNLIVLKQTMRLHFLDVYVNYQI